MNNAIIICSRVDSNRIPNKCFHKICGTPILERLIERLSFPGMPEIIVAVPEEQKEYYEYLANNFDNVFIECGSHADPMRRMLDAARSRGIDNIIRICHDKIFVEPDLIIDALVQFREDGADYLYSSQFTPGSGFEIISKESLERAVEKYTNVEHVGYAVKAVTSKIMHYRVPDQYRSEIRLLIDFYPDLDLMEAIIKEIGSTGSLATVIKYVESKCLYRMNQLPKVTIYTCVYNGEKYLRECIESVINQSIFLGDIQYIVIDDCSTDSTTEICDDYKLQLNYHKMPKNIGLAACSNKALEMAKGEYIIRLDADDYFMDMHILEKMLDYIAHSGCDALYPDNNFQKAEENHHVGGAMFKTRAINAIKFNDKLRGYEGLDFFIRGKDMLNINYFREPVFYYRQREDSMSHTDLEERARLKEEILNGKA